MDKVGRVSVVSWSGCLTSDCGLGWEGGCCGKCSGIWLPRRGGEVGGNGDESGESVRGGLFEIGLARLRGNRSCRRKKSGPRIHWKSQPTKFQPFPPESLCRMIWTVTFTLATNTFPQPKYLITLPQTSRFTKDRTQSGKLCKDQEVQLFPARRLAELSLIDPCPAS